MMILIADDDSMTRVALRKNLGKWGYHVSIGVASAKDPGESLEAILKRADNAMYQAKKNGRNQTVSG